MIRHAGKDDIAPIMEMGREFFIESGLADCAEFDGNSFQASIRNLIEGTLPGTLLIAELDGAAVGMAASLFYPFYFNTKIRVAQELFWFIRHGHRFGAGSDLLDELELSAKRQGVTVFIAASMSGLRERALQRFYTRRGYKAAENTYIKRI